MKSLVVAIERDRDQAARLENVVRTRVGADLVLAGSTSDALAALGDRIPDLILAPPLLPARDEAAVADRLRQLGPMAAHVQTITVPRLGSGSSPRTRKEAGLFKRLRRADPVAEETAPGCDPDVFAQQLLDYLQRAQADRAAAAESVASAASGREVNHRTAEVLIPASLLFAAPPAQDLGGIVNAEPPVEEPCESVSFDPLLEILRPHRNTQQAPWSGNIDAAPSELLAPPAEVPETPATEPVPAAALGAFADVFDADSLFASDAVLPAVADDTSPATSILAAPAESYEQDPVVPVVALVESEPVVRDAEPLAVVAAEPLTPVAAPSYEQEPTLPGFPAVEPPPMVCAAEPLVAVAALSYEQEPIFPAFPIVEPAPILCAAEPLVAVAAASYEQEPIAPLFPAVSDGAGDLPFDPLFLLGEPDEEIASALAAAASVTGSFVPLTPDTSSATAVTPNGAEPPEAEAIDVAAEDELPVVEEPADEESSAPAPVDDPQALTLPAIDFSDLELEFLVDEEPQRIVAEPAAPATSEMETPFVIAAADFDNLEISEFLEALVTADPEPPKPPRASKRPAAAQRATPRAAAGAAAAGATSARPAAAKAKAATRAASKKRRARAAAQRVAPKQPVAAARPAAPARPPAPIQDEWGVFDPDQCGFAALVAKLDDVTDDEPASTRERTSTRVISYS